MQVFHYRIINIRLSGSKMQLENGTASRDASAEAEQTEIRGPPGIEDILE